MSQQPHTANGPHGTCERAPADDERSQLQLLVGELLTENQKLRFEVEGLRARAQELDQQKQDADAR
jgi:regulator of replication initiation timing